MMDIFDRLNNEVLRDIKKCKKKKTCKDLTCRGYYFEPNNNTIKKWQSDGLYSKRIDWRAMLVCGSPGPSNPLDKDDAKVTRCWEIDHPDPKARWRLLRFLELRKTYGLENCYITNVVKCGVRKGTNHTDEEINNCSDFLRREIQLIKPKRIIAVGREAEQILRRYHQELIKSLGTKLIVVMHYSARRNPFPDWDKKLGG